MIRFPITGGSKDIRNVVTLGAISLLERLDTYAQPEPCESWNNVLDTIVSRLFRSGDFFFDNAPVCHGEGHITVTDINPLHHAAP